MSEQIKKLCPDIPDNWVFFREIDFKSVKELHVDTRDFHVLILDAAKECPTLDKIVKHSGNFFFTEDELKTLLERYYVESGGNTAWRYFTLEKYNDWFKYIRCYSTEYGWLVCDRWTRALNKEILNSKVVNDNG